jgi:hypothetical protein
VQVLPEIDISRRDSSRSIRLKPTFRRPSPAAPLIFSLNRKIRLAIIWAIPFGLFAAYLAIVGFLVMMYPHLRGLPSTRTIEGAAAVEILASPLWVGLAIAAEYVFGGIALVYFVRLVSNPRFPIRRKFVISARKETIEEIANEKQVMGSSIDAFSFKSFGKVLALAMGLNLAYTLFLERYNGGIIHGPEIKIAGNYLLLPQFILLDFGIAVLFLPLIEIVMPLFLGRIRIRQVDGFPTEYFWLGYVYSAAGGISLVLLFLNLLEGKTGSRATIIATLFVYTLISWYTALGSVLGCRYAEKKLAQGIEKLHGKKNIYFGNIFVGKNRQESEQV